MANKIALIMICLVTACSRQDNVRDDEQISSQSTAVENRGSNTEKWWKKLPRADWKNYEKIDVENDWFEVYRVAPSVYAIYEPGHFEEVISFLIIGSEKALLFDTGLGLVALKPISEALTEKHLIVINSHTHFDHVGGNHEFGPITGIDSAFAIERSKGTSNDTVREYVEGDWLAREPYPGFDPADYHIWPWQRGDEIDDGDVINLGDRTLEVIKTPGHSPDSIALLDRDHRLLFVGDTFYLAPLYAHLAESDFTSYKTSVDRLAMLESDVDYLMTGHNVPKVEARYLGILKDAFQSVADRSVPAIETDGALEYTFEDFSIIVPAD